VAAFEKTGDWKKVERMLSGLGDRFKREIQKATNINGKILEVSIYEMIEKQRIRPLLGNTEGSRRYLARKIRTKGKSKTLEDTASLMNNIKYHGIDWSSGFVGINRGATGTDGQDLVQIGAVHEYGTKDGRIPPRPFVATGVKRVESQVVKNYEEAVERAIGR